jgi:hypothetical protein
MCNSVVLSNTEHLFLAEERSSVRTSERLFWRNSTLKSLKQTAENDPIQLTLSIPLTVRNTSKHSEN